MTIGYIKEEINFLEAGLKERSMNLYAAPILIVCRKSKSGAPLAETERLIIDYHELHKQISKVQTTQAKSEGSLALIETAKIDHIWSGYHQISVHPDSRPKTTFTYPYGKFQCKG